MTAPYNQGSILIIDDNEDMLAMLAIRLRSLGHTVTARENFELLEKEITLIAPEIILIDKNLGWTDGCVLCTRLRKFPQFAQTVIIIFSAYELDAQEVGRAGANGCFEKPQGMQAFIDNIESYFSRQPS